jgi:putative transcriptional regulator
MSTYTWSLGYPMIRVVLREYLDTRDISLRELARRANTHPEVISRFSRQATSGVSYDLLDRICLALRCQPSDLLVYSPVAEQISLFDGPDTE